MDILPRLAKESFEEAILLDALNISIVSDNENDFFRINNFYDDPYTFIDNVADIVSSWIYNIFLNIYLFSCENCQVDAVNHLKIKILRGKILAYTVKSR